MKISLNWLSQYIDLAGLSVDEMSDMLTFAGIEVEDIRQQGVDSPYVVVARVAAAEQHPQADRLKVCQVDVGDGTLHQIVCGAQNYKVGDKVPCALPYFFSAVKMAVPMSIIGAAIGEWLGAKSGLGYFSRRMMTQLDGAGVFAPIVLLSAAAILAVAVVNLLEKRFVRWRGES